MIAAAGLIRKKVKMRTRIEEKKGMESIKRSASNFCRSCYSFVASDGTPSRGNLMQLDSVTDCWEVQIVG